MDSSSQPFPPFFCGGKICAMVRMGSAEYFPLNSFTVTVPVGSHMQGWFPLAGLPWMLFAMPEALRLPSNHQGTSSQAHLLAMSLTPRQHLKVNIGMFYVHELFLMLQ